MIAYNQLVTIVYVTIVIYSVCNYGAVSPHSNVIHHTPLELVDDVI